MNLKHFKTKKNALTLISVTELDLYEADLNLGPLMGFACPHTCVGISSIHRQLPNFTKESFSDEETEYQMLLVRACKVGAHEVGHMFGLLHCVYYDCAMNGSGILENTDKRPLYFCPVCYRKLIKCLDFDHLERYEKLV